MFRNRSVSTHQFAMIPRADIPRSTFRIQKAHKTTFDAGWLIPVFVDEILPGDSFNLSMTAFARLATPLFPVMDNMYLDSFFFFVPNRLVWDNWQKFMGEQDNPGDSTSYIIPTVTSALGGFPALTIGDYFGLPTVGQVNAGNSITVSALPFRAYALIYNQWFRDENIQNSLPVLKGDGPDPIANYNLARRGKRHDYFTSALPWPQKGSSVPLPLGSAAPIYSTGLPITVAQTTLGGSSFLNLSANAVNSTVRNTNLLTGAGNLNFGAAGQQQNGLFADLSQATAATINQLRQSFQIQKLLERDARGGTRYTEIIRSHFGVISPDARLQRPEYLGGGSTPININPIAQTSGTGGTGQSTPQGNLAAMGTAVVRGNGFRQSFTEHGIIIGLVSVRADLTYQQGIRKMWNRSTRYDFYFPAFAMLGEQAVLRKEIWATGDPTSDNVVFGYQERWAEYRYNPSQITGLFRSTTAGTLDAWHWAQNFASAPTLSTTFIVENPPVSRTLAVGAGANGQQFLFDSFFDIKAARPMPLYSVPGLIDHF